MIVKVRSCHSFVNMSMQFAEEQHKYAIRKNGQPYINHPYGVVKNVKKYLGKKCTPEILAAAWNHDIKEEANIPDADIIEKFGSKVNDLIDELTITAEMRKKFSQSMPVAELIEIFGTDVERLIDIIHHEPLIAEKVGKILSVYYEVLYISDAGLTIKLCDRLNNISDLLSLPADFRDSTIFQTELILKFLEENRRLTDIHKEIIHDIRILINVIKEKVREKVEVISL